MAIHAGADALGFVFHRKSPRYIEPKAAQAIIAQLPAERERVGVFVGELGERAVKVFNRAKLTALQFHVGLEAAAEPGQPEPYSVDRFWQAPNKIYMVMPAPIMLEDWLASESSWVLEQEPAPGFSATLFDTIFLDSGTARQPGGTGKTFDWSKAAPMVKDLGQTTKVVVAGGLTPGNVSQAIRTLKPWGVDVVSGVEARPGKKDPEKVRAFIAAVREADKSA